MHCIYGLCILYLCVDDVNEYMVFIDLNQLAQSILMKSSVLYLPSLSDITLLHRSSASLLVSLIDPFV